MKRFLLHIFFLSLLVQGGTAQGKDLSYPLEFSLFNNGNFMPGAGVLGIWSPKIHPGFSVGTRFFYSQKDNHELFQTVKLGYFFHRHSQQAFQLYSEFGYRYKFARDFFVEPRFGAGYMLSIPNMQIFEFKDGEYLQKKWKGRHQLMGGLNVSIGYSFDKAKLPLELFLGYHFWVQAPFVNKYVPVLPNNSVHVGAIYYLPINSQVNEK